MKHRFHTSALRVLIFSLQFGIVLALMGGGVMLIRWIDGALRKEHVFNFFLYVSIAPLVIFFVLAAVGIIWRITVTPETLRCYTRNGRYFTVSWDSIESVEPQLLMGLPYLKIRSAEAKAELWLPLFLGRQKEFEDLAMRYAGPDNPLGRWFGERRSGPMTVVR